MKSILVKGINEKKYKVTHTDEMIEEEEIIELIDNNATELEYC